MTDLLELALDDLVPAFSDEPQDWRDVVARARRDSRPRYRPRRVALTLAVLAVGILAATPAFGLQGYVLHLLGRKNVSFADSPAAPNVVKKQFLDMPMGAPPQWNIPVRASEARVAGTFTIAGHPRKLWVAPTTKGGFCYVFERNFGGCRLTRANRLVGKRGQLGMTWQGGSPRRHVDPGLATRVGGDITAPGAARLVARYADGTTHEIPFIWLSRPIAAGFYVYDIPTSHWTRAHRLLNVTLYAASGRAIDREVVPYRVRGVVIRPRPRAHDGNGPKSRALPTAPSVAPTAPLQTGTGGGFRVVVGHNGALQFTQVSETPILSELRGQSAGFGCFRLTKEFGIFTMRGVSQGGRFASRVGFVLYGVGRPIDGCEVQASIGRRWPDRLGNHAAAEIPLTPRGTRFFADRAAARDLALFVRTRRVQRLRKERPETARRGILRVYGRALAHSRITISVDGDTLVFSERSSTGKLFTVKIRKGRIVKQNVRPYAFVF